MTLPRADRTVPISGPGAGDAADERRVGRADRPVSLGVWAEIWLVCKKDLLIERRARVSLGRVVPITLVLLIVFAFAFDGDAAAAGGAAAGLFWVSLLFGGVLLAKRSFDLETPFGRLDALALWTRRPAAAFAGKALALGVGFVPIALTAAVGLVVLFDVQVDDWPLFGASAAAGIAAICASAVLYGAMTAGSNGADSLIPLLLLPVAAPVLLAGTRAMTVAFGQSADNGWSWTTLLAVIAAVNAVVGSVCFGPLTEDA